MKTILFIFSCYLLLLSCITCRCDDGAAGHYLAQEISKPAAGSGNGNEENCNPCSCFCCPSPVYCSQKDTAVSAPAPFDQAFTFPLTDQHFISYNAHAIWQPPRLG